MNSKIWIAAIAVVLLVCCLLSVFFLMPRESSAAAVVRSGGEVIRTLDLSVDQTFVVEYEGGSNEITVRDGKVAVTAADCLDHYCMDMGYRSGGTPIVCLPNSLVIEFPQSEEIDGAVG